MNDLTELSLVEIIVALRKGEISCRALTTAYLERIQQFDPRLHAFLYTDEEGALSRAEAIDSQWLACL